MQAWHQLILASSALASILGLVILLQTESPRTTTKTTTLAGATPALDEFTAHSETLLRMIFVYWLLFCLASGLQNLNCLAGTDLQAMCGIIKLLSYLLTFSSVLCFPMHLFQARQTRRQINS